MRLVGRDLLELTRRQIHSLENSKSTICDGAANDLAAGSDGCTCEGKMALSGVLVGCFCLWDTEGGKGKSFLPVFMGLVGGFWMCEKILDWGSWDGKGK